MVYLQASLKLRAGKLSDFISMLNSVTPVLGKHGWKLLGSYASMVGRLNTVVDVWELPNAEAIQAGMSDPELAKFAPQISEIVEDETLTLMTKLPIS
ncbi:MAG: NIPSNAP family protein [Deltaproteobacteria bacterium]|nr:NIPSNAP family protein [Deltaproteobacteria bacterium]